MRRRVTRWILPILALMLVGTLYVGTRVAHAQPATCNFPTSVWAAPTVVNNVTVIVATYLNQMAAEVVCLEQYLLGQGGIAFLVPTQTFGPNTMSFSGPVNFNSSTSFADPITVTIGTNPWPVTCTNCATSIALGNVTITGWTYPNAVTVTGVVAASNVTLTNWTYANPITVTVASGNVTANINAVTITNWTVPNAITVTGQVTATAFPLAIGKVATTADPSTLLSGNLYITGSGARQLATPTGGQRVYILSYDLVCGPAVTATFVDTPTSNPVITSSDMVAGPWLFTTNGGEAKAGGLVPVATVINTGNGLYLIVTPSGSTCGGSWMGYQQ